MDVLFTHQGGVKLKDLNRIKLPLKCSQAYLFVCV